ncbi:uncharacterized protein EV422DRAFT_242547 [Fimicolochytrium jonesii]|uniref:uncharacterized protein n=1 Tax=Fimicolochytrium jonesii TaxID=1396493 RepID=UPI0022FE3145|nr:uncharacterized protein EV422DRAFT_242547 [Fimicolochytrium jonesii]KAI8825022.1 hypothetical protein EV422DRAFT_242547 [Fimicolochytrium jonesii]
MASPSVCCVCRQGSGDGQGFLVCSVPGCATTVHSACYSTSTTVKQQSQWRCDRCSSKDPALAVCTLCSHKEGAILAIEGGTPWVHSICKDWILKLRDREARSVSLSAIFRVGSKTWEGECSVCNGKTGSKRNCDAAGCKSVVRLRAKSKPRENISISISLLFACHALVACYLRGRLRPSREGSRLNDVGPSLYILQKACKFRPCGKSFWAFIME